MLKIIATILLFFMYVSQAWGVVLIQRTASSTSYVFHETFDGSESCYGTETDFENCDETAWNSAAGTPNYQGTGLTGTYALELADAGGSERAYVEMTFTDDEVWVSYQLKLSDGVNGLTLYWLYAEDVDDNALFSSRIMSDGRIRIEGTGGATAAYLLDESGGSTVYLPNGAATFYLKFRYKKGTGANAEVDVWYSTDGTWESTPGYSISDGVGTGRFMTTKVYNSEADTLTWTIDEVKGDNADISDY